MICFVCGILFFFPYSTNAAVDEVIKVCNKAVQPAAGGAAVQRPTIVSCFDLNTACTSIFTLDGNGADTLRDQADP